MPERMCLFKMNDFILFESWYLCTDCLVDAEIVEIEKVKASIVCPCCGAKARIHRQEAVIWVQKNERMNDSTRQSME